MYPFRLSLPALVVLVSMASGQSLSNLPPCGQTCVNNMLGQSQALGCGAGINATCLCSNTAFVYGIRDCSAAVCVIPADYASVIAFGTAYCESAVAPAITTTSVTSVTALTVSTTEAPSSALPTTLITTTDSAGAVFTVTGELLSSGSSTTTVPCHTVITTDAKGSTVTRTETGSSVLPTQLQMQKSSFSHTSTTTSVTTSSSSATSLSTTIAPSGGASDRSTWSGAALFSVVILGTWTISLALLA